MLLFLVSVLTVGAEVSATSPTKPPPGCPFPTGPYVQPDCGPDAYFEVCSYPCPPQNCSSLWIKYKCKVECCKPECRCKEGFLRDDKSGRCICQDECPPPKVCLLENEEYQSCGSSCPDTCDNYKDSGRVCTANCVAGCFCKRGYVRDLKTKTCLKPEKCPPPACRKNEKYNECGTACPLTCDNYRTPPPCTEKCVKGCFCEDGFVRNKTGICVSKKECPPPACRENEKYNECGTACPLTCDNYRTPPPCTQQCVKGCFCEDGFVRNKTGICVKKKECPPPACRENEKYNECGTACPLTCDNYRTPPLCTEQCVKGCFCEDGFVRNKTGICVKKKECPPPACRKNEKYNECGTACPLTCDNYRNPPPCTLQCVKGCFCEEGFVRNKTGICVSKKECPPPACRENEKYNECGTACPLTCDNYRTPPPCTQQCVKGCFCEDGFVRNKTGICVKKKECPPPACRENEKYNECGTACPLTCDNYRTPPPCTEQCVKGCFCEDGFVRNKTGICVRKKECPPPACRKNEKYNECGTACPLTCDNYRNPPPCTEKCVKGCFCEDGFVRNKTGICVSKKECPPPACRENEKYNECGTACPLTCDNYRTPPPCTEQCVKGCFCEDGFVRNKTGICVKKKECPPPACRENEKYNECGTACPLTCDNYRTPPPCTEQCVKGCFCEDGFVRNKTGICVKKKECPPPACRENEKYNECGTSCPLTCDNYRTPPPCTKQCVKGCFCEDGFVRNKTGICVRKKECPPPACRKNEKYNECGTACPLTCDNYRNPPPCTLQCVKGCFCEEGFVRNKTGICVSKKECPPPACRENEKYNECGTACPLTCDNYRTPPPCTEQCVKGCFCEDGFVRNKTGICVKKKECPPPACRENEKYNECGTACPLTCDNYRTPPPCTQQCVKGCFCEDGFVRNKTGICVKKKECPPICPAGEKFSECSAHCQDTCENYKQPNRPCTRQCQSGCVCESGTVRRKDGQCVPPSECSNPTCPVDEEYDPCSAHCEPTCEHHDPNRPCTAICKPGCRCCKGLVRGKDGKCIKLEECTKCGLNEHYEKNRVKCELTCKNYHLESIMGPCMPASGCFCDDGFVRNSTGICVRKKECPKPIICPANEVLTECYNTCHKTCKTRLRSDGRVCHTGCFESGCVCIEGYLRHDNGSCVPISQCSPPVCSANETYSACGSACPPTCRDRGNTCLVCTKQCVEDCFCDKKLVRADDGTCVAPNDCPPRTCSDPNEEFCECPSVCPPTDDCSNIWSKFNCSIYPKCCRPQCRCKSGYGRNKKGICVTTEQCLKRE